MPSLSSISASITAVIFTLIVSGYGPELRTFNLFADSQPENFASHK